MGNISSIGSTRSIGDTRGTGHIGATGSTSPPTMGIATAILHIPAPPRSHPHQVWASLLHPIAGAVAQGQPGRAGDAVAAVRATAAGIEMELGAGC